MSSSDERDSAHDEIIRTKRLSTVSGDNLMILGHNEKTSHSVIINRSKIEILGKESPAQIKKKKLKNEIIDLIKKSNNYLRKTNYSEYYLLSRTWFNHLSELLETKNDEELKIEPINNKEFLIDINDLDEIILLPEKSDLVLVKPKYTLIKSIKPIPISKDFWTFLINKFKGGPEVIFKNDFYDSHNKIDLMRWIIPS